MNLTATTGFHGVALSRRARRLSLAATAAMLAVTLTPGVSHADNSSTVTIVGTSDVSDSNLMAAVLQPGFEKAYPQYTLDYVPEGTGAAITTAESGAASGLLVHAASLENQFVAQGYSEEQYGRAIFYGDYVLLGPKADPAGVLTNTPHDIAGAFKRIAAAGAAGKANYVSRGGTPGTTVEEHAIWALTSGVTTCTVSAANGGGASPSTTTGACPATISYPSWYHATGLEQAGNIENADVCDYPHANCYVLTDRGTYEYLLSTGAISHLKLVTSDNAATAPGGNTLLINSFHAYAINPAKFASDPGVQINLAGAEAFLNWVTSPAAQAAVGAFEASGAQHHGPFLPDAAPKLTASKLPAKTPVGTSLTVKGAVTNVVPGTPPLAGVQVSLLAAKGAAAAAPVATTTTTATGSYALHYRPDANARYTVATPEISQIEIPTPTLNPPFGDLLQPTATVVGKTDLKGAVTLKRLRQHNGTVTVAGSLAPVVRGKAAYLAVYAAPSKKLSRGLKLITKRRLKGGARSFRVGVALRAGVTWTVQVKYADPGVIVAKRSRRRTVTVT
jgi:tungstate transport system substrate-binding protein